MKYDVDYFIKKFSAIPDDKWCTNVTTNDIGQHCAYGHCGLSGASAISENHEGDALRDLFRINGFSVTGVNDGYTKIQGSNPKERIINALKEMNHD